MLSCTLVQNCFFRRSSRCTHDAMPQNYVSQTIVDIVTLYLYFCVKTAGHVIGLLRRLSTPKHLNKHTNAICIGMISNDVKTDLQIYMPLLDSQSLYTATILENRGPNRGSESKTSKKVSGIVVNSTTTEHCTFVSDLPTTILIGPFQKT